MEATHFSLIRLPFAHRTNGQRNKWKTCIFNQNKWTKWTKRTCPSMHKLDEKACVPREHSVDYASFLQQFCWKSVIVSVLNLFYHICIIQGTVS
jgi:hypothetical protein